MGILATSQVNTTARLQSERQQRTIHQHNLSSLGLPLLSLMQNTSSVLHERAQICLVFCFHIFNPFTPKSDQSQIFPAASPEILYITQYEELGFYESVVAR